MGLAHRGEKTKEEVDRRRKKRHKKRRQVEKMRESNETTTLTEQNPTENKQFIMSDDKCD